MIPLYLVENIGSYIPKKNRTRHGAKKNDSNEFSIQEIKLPLVVKENKLKKTKSVKVEKVRNRSGRRALFISTLEQRSNVIAVTMLIS